MPCCSVNHFVKLCCSTDEKKKKKNINRQREVVQGVPVGAGPAWHSKLEMYLFQPPAAVRLNLAVVLYDTAP